MTSTKRAKTLPTPHSLLTSLISSISSASVTAPEQQTANPLKEANNKTKHIFLTLHVLFPNEFLPALDLLDRELITRLRVTDDSSAGHASSSIALDSNLPQLQDVADETAGSGRVSAARGPAMYYVRSAQQHTARASSFRSRASAYEHTPRYEVRLKAWSCSCPAFSFAAFPATAADNDGLASADDAASSLDSWLDGGGQWRFGGLTRGTAMPVCKHLLACVLVERCGMFAQFGEERTVSAEEMAGWAAGWGD